MTRPSFAIGSLVLGTGPRIAVPFTDHATRSEVGELAARGLDVAELRVDLYSSFATDHVLATLATFAGVPTLATIRHGDEGGGWRGSEAERLALYRALAPRVGGIDIEVASEIAQPALAAAREVGALAIGSFHDFAKTPDAAALEDVVARGRSLGADVVKIAATIASRDDLRLLARLLLAHEETGLIVIGMGARGIASRVLFPLLGSLITYASGATKTAPGQLALDDLVELLRRTGG